MLLIAERDGKQHYLYTNVKCYKTKMVQRRVELLILSAPHFECGMYPSSITRPKLLQGQDSNLRPLRWYHNELTSCSTLLSYIGLTGLEPATPSLEGLCSYSSWTTVRRQKRVVLSCFEGKQKQQLMFFTSLLSIAGEGLEPSTVELWARQTANCYTPRRTVYTGAAPVISCVTGRRVSCFTNRPINKPPFKRNARYLILMSALIQEFHFARETLGG